MKSRPNTPTQNNDRPAADQTAGTSGRMSAKERLNASTDIQNSHGSKPAEQSMAPAPQPRVTSPKSRTGAQSLQAAQLSDKAETDVQLVVGRSPKPPVATGEKKSYKISFRIGADLQYALSQYAIKMGCDESKAARHLIEVGLGTTPIVIAPKSPPQLLEHFAGALKKWSADFAKIKSRLNAPMPTTDDVELKALVENWRAIATQLQKQLPLLIQSSSAVADMLHCLDAERIQKIRRLYPTLCSWIKHHESKLTRDGATGDDIRAHLPILESLHAIRLLIEDLGIIEPEEG